MRISGWQTSAIPKPESERMRFDLADLRLFLNIAETGAITRGAERSHLSLPAASGRVRGMEAALGAPLLVRKRRGVGLTPAGDRLAGHARRILREVEVMRDDLRAFGRTAATTVSLMANTAALDEHLPPLLATFLAAWPEIDVEVREAESVEIGAAVAAGRADVGVANAAALSDAVATLPFRTDRLVLVAPADDVLVAGGGAPVALRDLLDREFVGLPRKSALQRHLDGRAARLGGRLRLRARLSGFDGVCRMVEAGAGLAIVPEAAARRQGDRRLAILPLLDDWATRELALCVRDLAASTPAARRLIDWLGAPPAGQATPNRD